MAKKKATDTTGLAILADFQSRVEAGDSLAKAHADMKRELRRTAADSDAALDTLLDIARRAHAGETFEAIGEYVTTREPAAEPPVA